MTKKTSVAAGFISIAGLVVMAQRPTIPERVERMRSVLCRQTPCETYATGRISEFAPAPFERGVQAADLIVHGSLRKIGTYFSDTKIELYTDFELAPANVVAQRPVQVLRTPGPYPVVVRQWGGDTVINGIPVKISDENFPALPVGQPLLLLLIYSANLGKYQVWDGGTGAFVVQRDGTLRQVLVPEVAAYERFKSTPLDAVIQEIHRLGR